MARSQEVPARSGTRRRTATPPPTPRHCRARSCSPRATSTPPTAVQADLQHLTNERDLRRPVRGGRLHVPPYRTTRFVATARQALADLGITDPRDHILVASHPDPLPRHYHRSPPSSVKQAVHPGRGRPASSRGLKAVPETDACRTPPGHPWPPTRSTPWCSTSDARLRPLLRHVPVQRDPDDRQRPVLLALRPLRHRALGLLPPDQQPTTARTRSVSGCSSCCWPPVVIVARVFLLLPFVAVRAHVAQAAPEGTGRRSSSPRSASASSSSRSR